MNNVYYSPENFGLELVAELYQPDMSYEFNMFVAWQHKESGRVFFQDDSGCSCPSPFENEHWNSPNDTSLEEVTKRNIESFETQVKYWCEDAGIPQHEREEFIDEVLSLVKQ